MICGTGECGCGCGGLHQIRVKPDVALKVKINEPKGEGPTPVLARELEPPDRSEG